MTQTNIILISAVVALLTTGAVLAAGVSWARSGGFGEERWSRDGRGHGMSHAVHDCGGDMNARLGHLVPYLENVLDVAPEQRPQWDEFVETVRHRADMFQELCLDTKQAGTVPQRLARFEGAAKEGLAALTDISDAATTLYESFSDVQRKKLDELLNHRGRHHARAHRDF